MTERPQPSGVRHLVSGQRAPQIAVVAAIIVGIGLRLRVLPSGGLFQDDAWVALTGTTSWNQAFKMAGTAPGFVGLLHLWLQPSSSSLWAVLPALVFGVLGLVSTAFVLRRLSASPWLCATGVVTIALSPVAVATSGHVKQYTLDFLIGLWITFLAVRARDLTTRALGLLVLASLFGLIFSGSTIVVVAAAWLVLFVDGLRNRRARGRVLLAACAFGLGFLAVFFALYRSLPVALTRYWADYLLQPSPVASWPSRMSNVLRGITTGFVPTSTSISHEVLFVTGLFGCLVLLGVLAKDPLGGRAIAVATLLVAFALAALHKVPLGTGRTDMAIYPALLILVLSGLRELNRKLATFGASMQRAAQLVSVLIVVVFASTAFTTPHRYLTTPITAALNTASTCATNTKPTLVIDAYTRYPYALTTPRTVTEHFSRQYGAGFTVSVPLAQATILPAQPYERPYAPKRWANEVADRLAKQPPLHRHVAYVSTPPGGPAEAIKQQQLLEATTSPSSDPFFAQLLRRNYVVTKQNIVGPLLVTCLQQH